MRKRLVIIFLALVLLFLAGSDIGMFFWSEKPIVLWYVVAKHTGDDIFQAAAEYKPDIILLTVYAEDDILPLNGSSFDLEGFVNRMHELGVKTYYSFSLFSRSALPREAYEAVAAAGTPYSEQALHVADFAKKLRQEDPARYHELFDYYFENGLDPEEIPHIERKPVEGFFIPPGHYTSIDPLYKPYHNFMVKAIEQMIQIAKPDGLAFDHVRFFTFDDGYNKDIRDWILAKYGLDIWNYTPKPAFQLDMAGWSEEDKIYYDSRAELLTEAVADIITKFPEYEKFGTTIGMAEPARANGQYVELQANIFDALLLMAYDKNPAEISRNVKETLSSSSTNVILGIYPFEDADMAIANIKAGLEAGATGIYLLGYKFDKDVHEHLLKARDLY